MPNGGPDASAPGLFGDFSDQFSTPHGEASTGEAEGRFGPVAELVAELGDPDAATTAAIELASASLSEVGDRDEIARQLCEALSFVYPNVLVLSPRLPGFLVWDAELAVGAQRVRGVTFEARSSSVWYHTTREGVAFLGTLRSTDPLRARLGVGFGREALVVPVCLNARTVALIVLNAGPAAVLAAPGARIAGLATSVANALRRVILLRKRSHRSV